MKKHIPIILFLFFYFLIISYKFISHPTPFYDWDESIYAQVGQEMVRAKSLVPLWQGQYWLDKPPLVPLAYGVVESITPLSPELSTRLFTLFISVIILLFIYLMYNRLINCTWISFLAVVITSFTPIFLQRSQVLNVDIFLFLGWLGYVLFYQNFWLSLLFLAIGVLSKSLLGFYPLIGFFIIETIQLYLKKTNWKEYKKRVLSMLIQIGILSLWFITMFAVFKFAFIKNQFLEAMLKRVTASIESHFGKRTFYIDTLIDQLKIFAYLSIVGIILLFKDFFTKKDIKKLILALFFVPWFLFLNLTKTKIDWYIYPVISPFAFLATYPLIIIKKHRSISLIIIIILAGLIINQNVIKGSFFTTYYSSYDENYQLAVYAKNNCKDITLLVDKDSRTTHDTLKNMNLLISTSEWWGNHPAIVYYSDKKVNFIYDVNKFNQVIENNQGSCFVVYDSDLNLLTTNKKIILEKKFNTLQLFK